MFGVESNFVKVNLFVQRVKGYVSRDEKHTHNKENVRQFILLLIGNVGLLFVKNRIQ